MFDVFYSGVKPNLFPHEQAARDIEHAREMSQTRYFWWVNYLTDYTGFDFLWEPAPWQAHYCQAWPSQWQKDAGTYLIPVQTSGEINYRTDFVLTRKENRQNWAVPDGADTDTFDFTWHPDATDPPYIYQFGTQHQRTGGPQYLVPGATEIKYVDQIRIRTNRVATAIYEIDHLDGHAGQIPDTTRTVRYFDNYLDTLRRLIKSVPEEHEFIWVCSSICDYSGFDFSWHPEQWQASMLHVFPSSGEKFGDTFFVHVPTFRYRAERLKLLDWYDINYMNIDVPRRPLPVIQHAYDTQIQAVQEMEFAGPLAIFTVKEMDVEMAIPAVPLWREKTKTIVPLSTGASAIIFPRAALAHLKTQLYDYANIDRRQRHLMADELLDIVFIDNGEPIAELNWRQLPHNIKNRIHRSSGVNGRVAAYRAAAELSTTPWFFAVFAKLEVDNNFNWAWQPDRLQEPKHYIFHAYNPVNDLTYGHQAIIAYNRQLVLENTAPGLDFTLDQAHEVVPVLSGTANYHYDAWTCWRTAFRETIKLRHSLPNIENESRLRAWLERDNTKDKWSQRGAEDAVEYYEAVAGDFAKLRKSYDWAWLSSYALIKRNLVANR